MRLFLFATDSGYEQIVANGFSDSTSTLTSSGIREGVELSESTRTDAFTPTSCWLVVVEVDEERIAPYEERQPGSPLLRAALHRLNLGAHGREWLVPAAVLNEHGRIVDAGDFSNPTFAVHYRT